MVKYYETQLYIALRNWFFAHVMNPLAYWITSNYRILSSFESIKFILEHRCSVSRYGDGEFYVMMGAGNGFQDPNNKLAERLRQVITTEDAPNFMVGIPLPMKDLSGLIDGYPPFFWRFYMGKHVWFINRFIKPDRTYLNTQFTRFYYEVKDKSQCGEHIALIRQIWENIDIVIVEGEKTRSGVGNDLYDNAKSVQRILGPATNAFDRYDEILSAITTNVTKERLILLSLGMTATVLAYDLAKLGYWAIDLGHLDIEYEWYLQGLVMDKPIPVQGKFTNEANGGNTVDECQDPVYLSQIICNLA